MPAFENAAHLKAVFGGMLQSFAENDPIKMLAGSGLIMSYVVKDPDVTFTIDASVEPKPGANFAVHMNNPSAPKAHVTFFMSGDTLDGLYSGAMSPMAALSSGAITTEGNREAALKLLPAMFATIPRYKKFKEKYVASLS